MMLKLPRLSNIPQIVNAKQQATISFSRFWNDVATQIEGAVDAIAGYGTAADADTGTSGHTVPFLDTENTFSAAQTVPSLNVGANKVIDTRDTGWAVASGTGHKGTFAADHTQTISVAYVQAESQSMQNDLLEARQHIKALEDALIHHGLIGA